ARGVEAKPHGWWQERSRRLPARAPGPPPHKDPARHSPARPASLVAPPMHMTAGVRQRGASMSSGVDRLTDVSLEVFSTCVQSSDGDPETYVQRVADVARWSEQAG